MEEVFGKNITAINKSTFKDVMETVAGGEAKFGVLPIEIHLQEGLQISMTCFLTMM